MVRTRKKLTETQQHFIKTGAVESIPEISDNPYIHLPLDKLESWNQQPRHYFNEVALQNLAATLKKEGIKHPILVRIKKDRKDRYEVIAGERRFQAAKLAQLKTVPALIEDLDDRKALELALSENLHREDLNPVEILDSMLALLGNQLGLDDHSVCSLLRRMKYQWEKLETKTQDINIPNPDDNEQKLVQQALKQYGYNWYSFTCNYLKLREIPKDLYEAIAEGRIEYSKGLLFKPIKDDQLRKALLKEALAFNWTQIEIQQQIKEKLNTHKLSEKDKEITPQQEVKEISSRLKKVKPWKEYPSIWKKIKRNLATIERHLSEIEDLEKQSE